MSRRSEGASILLFVLLFCFAGHCRYVVTKRESMERLQEEREVEYRIDSA